MAKKRKNLSKRQRFEVFKRDGFTCQYCGRKPPEAILEADHMVPVADGGDDHESNMVTSCQDCNRGKSDRPLTAIPAPLESQIADRTDRAEQTRAYNQFLLDLREEELATVRRLSRYWCDRLGLKGKILLEPDEESIRRFLKKLPEAEILDSIDTAFGKRPPYGKDDRQTWKYFCGVCWKKIKDSA